MTKFIFLFFIFSSLLNLSVFGQKDSISILSWNVFLRPSIMKDSQIKRAESIAKFLYHSNADILVLQELFHRRAKRIISKKLKDKYPYKTRRGPVSFFGVSSGVMIYSKIPILKEKRISFKNAIGSDKMAKKGAVKATMKMNNKTIHTIGTHMQAGKGRKRNKIRRSQLRELKKLVNTLDTGDLIFYAGDFNLHYQSKTYNYAKNILNSEADYPNSSVKHTANFKDQDYYPVSGNPSWIDFIFINKKKIKGVKTKILEPKAWFKKKKKRISDHNPIISTIKL